MARNKKPEGEKTGFGDQPQGSSPRLTPVDIQQKVFRLAFRGYNERDVDEFLDRVTEALAALHEENKRLREQGGGGESGDVAAARSQAETIVREAREHAARLREDAGDPTATSTGGGGGLTAAFLVRERDFLQRMANSVQEHARWMKEEAQRQQSQAPVAATPAPKSGKAADGGKKAKVARTAGPPKGAGAQATASAAEATAAWGPPQADMGEPASGWTQAPQPGEPDPLLSAWESAFTADGPESQSEKTLKDGEPSLKELFWGEE